MALVVGRFVRGMGVTVSVRGLLVGTALVASAPASAQCAPDPTFANGTTTCVGSDPNGFVVTATSTTIQVNAGATVTGSGGPAIRIATPGSSSTTVNVLGAIDGGSQVGISLVGPSATFGGSNSLTLTIAVGARVTGVNALTLAQDPANSYPFNNFYVTVDNSGSLSGTGGIAIVNGASFLGGTLRITNRAGGTIGAISGSIDLLDNAGTIDGGTRSAISFGSTYSPQWTNSGTITSASGNATIASSTSLPDVFTNSGTISNSGSGAALQGSSIIVTNTAGAWISTAGGTAISTTGSLRLTNAGTITGNVSAGFATIDSSAGTINGNVTLGSGDDVVAARYVGTPTLATGITGTLNAGGGTNTIQINAAQDITINTAVNLPGGFQRIRLAPANGVTLLLDRGFVAPGTIDLSGQGSIINRATIMVSGQAFTASTYPTTPASFSNEGSIRAGATNNFALSFGGVSKVDNSGSIDAAGGGIDVSVGGTVTNSGTILAVGTALNIFDAVLNNSGTIRSTGGIGVSDTGNVGIPATNSGNIQGATYGVSNSIALTNTGTIGGGIGGVQLQAYGTVFNAAGATISGGAYSIDGRSAFFNSAVYNAGTLNGNVVLQGVAATNTNIFVALPGGVLNGNLTLGDGIFVTELAGSGAGRFAGVTGTVSGNNATLRYRVSANTATSQMTIPAGFATVGYQLENNAALTITAPAPQTQQLSFAGQGSVDLTATISTTTTPAILTTSVIRVPGTNPASNALAITSRGNLAVTRANTSSFPGAVVVLGSGDTFTNAGTISATDRTAFPGTAAISGGATVTNTGTVHLDGAIGVSNANAVVNIGTISQIAGGLASRGVINSTLDNRGTINVGGIAVQNSRTTNSGIIASTASVAVDQIVSLTNLAGGTITGATGQLAVRSSGGAFSNAGAVLGDVDLGFGSFGRSFSSGTYVAAGGTITGSLKFGSGDDLFLQTGDTTSVSGIIDGGSGRNIFGRTMSTTGSFALDGASLTNFPDRLLQVVGRDTTATVTATAPFANTVYFVGDGTIRNQASISGQVIAGIPFSASQLPGFSAPLAQLINDGTLSGGLTGAISTFINNGRIDSVSNQFSSVSISNPDALTFTNNGQIGTAVSSVNVSIESQNSLNFANKGFIYGAIGAFTDMFGSEQTNRVSFSNEGLIIADTAGTAVTASLFNGGSGSNLSIGNSGSIINQNGFSFVSFGFGQSYGLVANVFGDPSSQIDFNVTNSGTISANLTEITRPFNFLHTVALVINRPGFFSDSGTDGGVSGLVTNSGVIRATGVGSVGIAVFGTALRLENSGQISGVGGPDIDGAFVAGGISSFGNFNDVIRNSGTINGSILLGFGSDSVVNSGTISANVAGPAILAGGTTSLDNSGTITGGTGSVAVQLGAANDLVTLRTGSIVTGAIVGGGGVDLAVLSGTLNTATSTQTLARFSGFDSLTVTSGYWTAAAASSAFNSVVINSGASLELANGATGLAGLTVPSITTNGTLVVRSSTASLGSTFGSTTVVGVGNTLLTGAGTALIDGLDTIRSGTLTVDGGTTLVLTGTQGGYLVTTATGTFQLGTGGTAGTFSGSLANDGIFNFNRSDSVMLSGAVTGGGMIIKNGAGTLTFGTGYAFTGTTMINAGSIKLSTPVAPTTELDVRGSGTLDLSGTQQVVAELAGNSGTASVNIAGGSLTVNQGSNTSFAGNLQGSGSLTKTGTGTLNITGANTYSGPTTVSGGRLAVNGSIVSPTTVASGGTLGGTGTVSSVTIASGGVLAPGNSVGTINVVGPLSFAAGSTFQVEANTTAADRIIATGAATLSGGTVAVIPDLALGAFGKVTTYNIVTASAVTGTFGSVTSANATLLPLLSYTATGVNLTLARPDLSFGAITTNPNQLAVANAVQARGFGNAVFNAVLIQPTAAAGQAAFDNLSGEIFASLPSILMDEGKRVREAVIDRAALRGDGAGAWAAGLVNNARSDVQGPAAASDTDRKGVVSGLDYGRSYWRAGVGAGYVKSNTDIAARASHADVETKLVTAYGGLSYGKLSLTLAATYSWHDIDTRRGIAVGALSGTATSSYKAKTFQFTEEASYAVVDTGAFRAAPFVGIGLIRSHSDAATEAGTAAALGIAANTRKVGFGTGGLRMGGNARVSNGVALLPHMSLSYTHAWGELTGTSLAAFGGTATTFRTTGAVLGRNTTTADGGLDLAFGNRFRIGAGGYAASDKAWDDYGAKVSVGFNF